MNFRIVKCYLFLLGIVSLFRGIGCFTGPYIGGVIADNFSMSKAFYFSSACYLIGCTFSAIVSFGPAKKTEKNNREVQSS